MKSSPRKFLHSQSYRVIFRLPAARSPGRSPRNSLLCPRALRPATPTWSEDLRRERPLGQLPWGGQGLKTGEAIFRGRLPRGKGVGGSPFPGAENQSRGRRDLSANYEPRRPRRPSAAPVLCGTSRGRGSTYARFLRRRRRAISGEAARFTPIHRPTRLRARRESLSSRRKRFSGARRG